MEKGTTLQIVMIGGTVVKENMRNEITEPVSEGKKNKNYKRSSVLGWRLIPISWYIDSDL